MGYNLMWLELPKFITTTFWRRVCFLPAKVMALFFFILLGVDSLCSFPRRRDLDQFLMVAESVVVLEDGLE